MGSSPGRWRVGGFALSYGLLKRSARLPDSEKPGYCQRLIIFIGDFTCSRCWRALVALARLRRTFEASKTGVQVIGDGRYLHQAKALAADLGLPFSFANDESGALRRLAEPRSAPPSEHASAAVLIGRDGLVRHRQQMGHPDETIDEAALIEAMALPRDC